MITDYKQLLAAYYRFEVDDDRVKCKWCKNFGKIKKDIYGCKLNNMMTHSSIKRRCVDWQRRQ